MENKILKFCLEKGILLDKEVLNLFSNLSDDEARRFLEKLNLISDEKIITKSFFDNNSSNIREIFRGEGEEKKIVNKLFVNLGLKLEITRERIEKVEKKEEFRKENFLIKNIEVPIRKISVEDFVKNFNSRFLNVKRILQDRAELEGLTSIDKLGRYRQASIIGIVSNKRTTKNKNILLNIEDMTGRLNVLINHNNKEVFDKAKGVIFDDIIGIKGTYNKELFFASDILYPEAILPEKKRFEEEKLIAFTSDIHLGSNNFLEKNFLKFIKWINGETGDEEQKKMAKKVKYLFLTGDSIDGVGVFPGQEDSLIIKDAKGQYDKLAEYLDMIRKDVEIFICPGQHDAVRVAEPQPSITYKYGEALHKIKNIHLVSNPAIIELREKDKGIKILMYHGQSFHGLIGEIEDLRMNNAHDSPARVAKEILRRRHVTPLHSEAIYIPSDEDSLFIKEIPDIFATGDLHKPDIDVFNNILIVASSCWQSITPFEEKVGNHPDPCKVPIYNLKTREIKILDFN